MAARKPRRAEPPFTPRLVGGTRSQRAKAGNGRGTLRKRIAALRSNAGAPVMPRRSRGEGTKKASAKKRKERKKGKNKKPATRLPVIPKTARKTKLQDPKGDVRVGRMSDVEAKEVGWLWYPYFALGKITFVEGDPNSGKSWIACAIAAAETAGLAWPGSKAGAGKHGPTKGSGGNVLILTCEDGIADTVRPRLEKVGADLDKVFFIADTEDKERVDLKNIKLLEQAIAEVKPRLLIVDPLTGFVGSRVNMHSANGAREVLRPVAGLAEKHGVGVLIIRHLRKSRAARSMYRGLGSIDFAAAARSVLLVGKTSSGLRAVAHTKSNLAPAGVSIGYELDEEGFRWIGPVPVADHNLLASESRTRGRDEAVLRFLREVLPCKGQDAIDRGREAGIQPGTLRRVGRNNGMKTKPIKLKGKGRGKGYTLWYFPEKEGDA